MREFGVNIKPVPRNMPVDYTSYLLSASPPGFDFFLARNFDTRAEQKSLGGTKSDNVKGELGLYHAQQSDDSPENSSESLTALALGLGHGDLDHIDVGLGVLDLAGDDDCAGNASENNNSNVQTGLCRLKKKVSFADEKGLSLTCVKIMRCRPDSPPLLRPDILFSLTHGASAEAVETPPLVLNFAQPASEYMAFREKIDRNFVSLENAILKDYRLFGTIRVKNVAFEKEVFVRCTFDSWATSTDISATYVANDVRCHTTPYDTFSFKLDIPPSMDVRKTVQFAICFMAQNQQFWDNNSGQNYEVVSANWKSNKERVHTRPVFSMGAESISWSEFSSWQNIDPDVPYW